MNVLFTKQILFVRFQDKCSHGGFFDQTSTTSPLGGINKDTIDSSHGFLHQEAANLAVDATLELLEDIRLAVGEISFLRFGPPSPEPFLNDLGIFSHHLCHAQTSPTAGH